MIGPKNGYFQAPEHLYNKILTKLCLTFSLNVREIRLARVLETQLQLDCAKNDAWAVHL